MRDEDERERLELALDCTGDGVWEWWVDTGEVAYDQHWQHVLGYEPGERAFDFAWWQESVHPDSLPTFAEALRAYLDGRAAYYELEYRIRRKDGDWRWICSRQVRGARRRRRPAPLHRHPPRRHGGAPFS